jgi:hypothetical protein
MKIYLYLIPLLLLSCSSKNELEGKTQTVRLSYIAWACECANWHNVDDTTEYKNQDKLAAHCIFIEPADDLATMPDTLGYSGDMIEFTGQYYKNKGYAKGFIKTEEPVAPAKVFRYTHFRVIQSNYEEFKHGLKK